MSLRLGTGTLPSRTTVQLPSRMLDAAEDWDRLNETVQSYRAVDGVPVVDRLSDAGAIGVAGSDLFASDVARALMLQVAGLHSPAQVAIAAFAPADTASEWEWLKWLPHVDSPHHPLSASLADDIPASGKMLAELEGLVASPEWARPMGTNHPRTSPDTRFKRRTTSIATMRACNYGKWGSASHPSGYPESESSTPKWEASQ